MSKRLDHPLEFRGLLDGGVASRAFLPADLVIAEPDVAGPLAVFPLLATPGEFEYLSFAEAASRGFRLTERKDASVNDLRASNPLDVAVLLFDGEVVEGAQQDRIPDVSVLLGPGTQRRVPVSCVEEGRWDDERQAEPFAASASAAPPSLRAAKNRRVRESLRRGLGPRADQEELWERIAGTLEAFEVESRSGAMRDLYLHHRHRLRALEAAVRRRDGQVGATVCLAGSPVVLDYVSRAEVWAALWRPLLRGYCLDALACGTDDPRVGPGTAESFLAAAEATTPVRHRGVGMGDLLTLTGGHAAGSGLMLGRELIQASVFAAASPASSDATSSFAGGDEFVFGTR
jgi:hypothetical protein